MNIFKGIPVVIVCILFSQFGCKNPCVDINIDHYLGRYIDEFVTQNSLVPHKIDKIDNNYVYTFEMIRSKKYVTMPGGALVLQNVENKIDPVQMSPGANRIFSWEAPRVTPGAVLPTIPVESIKSEITTIRIITDPNKIIISYTCLKPN